MNRVLVALVVCLIVTFSTTFAFRCQEEKNLDVKTNKTEFQIRPQKSLDGKFLWVTNMNIFLFGNIERQHNAKFQAGFYDDETGALIYKVIISCEDGGTWKTVYDKKGNGKFKKWKSGKIEGGCKKGEFDLIAKIGCPESHEFEDVDLSCAKMAYFVFNGQVLENNFQTVPRYEAKYVEELPVFIRQGKLIKAEVLRDGATFTQQSYGKCFDFPTRLHKNCTAAAYWVLGRSDSPGLGVGEMGLWSMQYNVECQALSAEDPNHVYFSPLQNKIVPDGSATFGGRGFMTCCCAYMDGYVGSEETCLNNYDDYKNCNLWPQHRNDERCNSYKGHVFADSGEVFA